jgi:hypothetical protein
MEGKRMFDPIQKITPIRMNLFILCYLLTFVYCLPVTFSAEDKPQPQCAQFCVHFSCKLLGVPLSMNNVMELFPPKERGESMLEIREILEKMGLTAEGRRIDPAGLLAGPYPMVAYVNQNHFVVVQRADRESIAMLDGYGRRRMVSTKEFLKSWNGEVLLVGKPTKKMAFPTFVKPQHNRPCVQFDTLFIDVGQIPDGQQDVTYEFPFENLGTADLKIQKVHMTCKCTAVASMPEKPVPPGGRDKVVVRYEVSDRRGPFTHTLYIQSDDARFPVIPAVIAGNSTQQLFVKPDRLELTGRLGREGGNSGCCYIRYTGDAYFELSGPVTDVKGLRVSCHRITQEMVNEIVLTPKVYRIDQQYLYAVRVTLDPNEPGTTCREGKVTLQTNLERYPTIEIPVVIKAEKPIYSCPSILYLGEVQPGSNISAEITLMALQDREFSIDTISTGTTALTCTYDQGPTQRAKITFTGVVPAEHGSSAESVRIRVAVPSLGRVFPVEVPVRVWYRGK